MRHVLICLLLLAADPATALSCLRPDSVRLFEMARDAEEKFYIVKGRVSLLEAPNQPKRGSGTPTFTRARLTGLALSQGDFQAPFARDVLIKATCLGPWCGTVGPIDGEMIMAIEVSDSRLTLNVGPCGGDLVSWDMSAEKRLIACYKDGDCRPAEF